MCKARISTGCRWLVGLVLFCKPLGALAQAPQNRAPDFHESNPPLAWGPIGHGNNEHSVPGLNGLDGLADLLPPQPLQAPLVGAPRSGAVPSPGAGALLALAALGTGRRRRRG